MMTSSTRHLPATPKSLVDTLLQPQGYRKRWNSPLKKCVHIGSPEGLHFPHPIFKCSWQRPALLSAKANLHFQLQTFIWVQSMSGVHHKPNKGTWLSLPHKAGVARPCHRSSQANPSDLLRMFLRQREQEMLLKGIILRTEIFPSRGPFLSLQKAAPESVRSRNLSLAFLNHTSETNQSKSTNIFQDVGLFSL